MLITLLAWMYISFLCYNWGRMFVGLLNRINTGNSTCSPAFCITCFTGLAVIGTLAQLLSLMSGLSNVGVQLLFFVPALFFFITAGYHKHLKNIRLYFTGLHPVTVVLLISVLLMVLIMSVYPINHPDTLSYHAQLIKWAERYRVVPGLVHVNYHYGFQSTWFLLCALFSFSFTGANALTFTNTVILAWWIIFIVQKINGALQKTITAGQAAYWLLLLIVNVSVYTHIRLTATSGSPDFIAAIYILLPVYLALTQQAKDDKLLIIFLCFFAITVKLSALPVIFLAFYFLFPLTSVRSIVFVLMAVLVSGPFLTRNIVTSGHLLFPAPFPDIIHTDWKYATENLRPINQYIRSYAITHDKMVRPRKMAAIPLTGWLGQWWAQLYLTDKLLIVIELLCVVMLAVNYKRFMSSKAVKKICILLTMGGLVFWFVTAPDPRFGIGFLLLFPALILPAYIGDHSLRKYPGKNILLGFCVLVSTAFIFYSAYRVKYYFNVHELIAPDGITAATPSVYYKEIKINIPLTGNDTQHRAMVSSIPARRAFEFRGKTVLDGFKAKEKPDSTGLQR
jgi:hypothetical protein